MLKIFKQKLIYLTQALLSIRCLTQIFILSGADTVKKEQKSTDLLDEFLDELLDAQSYEILYEISKEYLDELNPTQPNIISVVFDTN